MADQNDEEVLNQGPTYKEQGAEPDLDELLGVNQATSESDDAEKEKSTRNNNKIIIIVVVVLLLFGLFTTIYVQYSKAQKAAEKKRLEALLEEENEVPFTYTSEEIEELRVNGYTGDEIESFEFQAIPAQNKIDEAEAARKAKYDAEIAPYYDMATDEFKQIYSNTWLGQADLVFGTDTSQYMYYEKTLNVDYEKLPPKGHQLFIKFYISNGDACFMTVTPERYIALKDTGNIVLDIKYTQTPEGSKIITDLKEITP